MYLLLAVSISRNIDWDRCVYRARIWSYQCRWATRISYNLIFQHGVPRETCAMYNNARDWDNNSRRNYCGNFQKCRLITQFSSNKSLYSLSMLFWVRCSDGKSLPYVHGVSVIALRYGIACQLKNNSRGGKYVFCNFSMQLMYSYGKAPFRVKRFEILRAELAKNSECTIFNLSLI